MVIIKPAYLTSIVIIKPTYLTHNPFFFNASITWVPNPLLPFLSTCRKDASSSKCSYSSITSLLKPSWFLAPICEPCSSSSLVATMKSSLSFSFLFFSFLSSCSICETPFLHFLQHWKPKGKFHWDEMSLPQTKNSLSLKNTIEKPLELNMGEWRVSASSHKNTNCGWMQMRIVGWRRRDSTNREKIAP